MLVVGLAGQKEDRAFHRELLSSQSLNTAPGGVWERQNREVVSPKSRVSGRESIKQPWLLSTEQCVRQETRERPCSSLNSALDFSAAPMRFRQEPLLGWVHMAARQP